LGAWPARVAVEGVACSVQPVVGGNLKRKKREKREKKREKEREREGEKKREKKGRRFDSFDSNPFRCDHNCGRSGISIESHLL
jgi:hypothetical protein